MYQYGGTLLYMYMYGVGKCALLVCSINVTEHMCTELKLNLHY